MDCLEIKKKVLGESHEEVARAIFLIASVLRDKGDYATAISRFEECLEIRKNAQGVDHPEYCDVENHIMFTNALWQPRAIDKKSLEQHESRVANTSWKGAGDMQWRLRLIDVLLTRNNLGLGHAEKVLALLQMEAVKEGYKKLRMKELRVVEEVLQKH